ncbi:hypothetical protein RJ639_043227 [Escallonia herrerae]|uniref:Golgin candidate 1 n=1 Tax=Escallonia herrerae TaxID=1293975 RepID=A0AA88WC43_9ASTE|nr:hypothetical protein RJ639_043227 [Escallonia herrerae]
MPKREISSEASDLASVSSSARLRACADLFEVVDRRAKLVVGENSDEQFNLESPGRNGIEPLKRLSSNESTSTVDIAREQTSSGTPLSDVTPHKDRDATSVEKNVSRAGSSTAQISLEEQQNSDRDDSSLAAPLSETDSSDEVKKPGADSVEVSRSVNVVEDIPLSISGDLATDNSSNVSEGVPSSPLSAKETEVEVVPEDHLVDSDQNAVLDHKGAPTNIDQEAFQNVSVDAPSNLDTQLKDDDLKVIHPDESRHHEDKALTSPSKVQDQLDEAQGLLKSALSTGQSKEARLARVCAGLSSRLQEYKSENAQLEELLVAERELSKSYEARMEQLQRDLSESKSEVNRVESNMAEALSAKNSEIEALVSSMDALKKQAALSEGNLASLQANMESIMRNRELTETRMMQVSLLVLSCMDVAYSNCIAGILRLVKILQYQALREELASAERRAEEEHGAHNATKMAAMEREVELEHRALDASTALARTQRIADERMGKAAELEQKVALLEVECASLNQELQDMEARARRGQKKSPEEANQVIQAELQKMRVETAAMKRDAEHYSRQEHMELEKRYRELTDLLYYKQTQLEAMASEKAAAEFQLEKEINRIQEVQVEVERSRASRRALSSWEEDTDMKALEPLPLHHRHMVGASIQLQKAAKLLDSGAVRATRFLWRYPIARVLLLFYLVFMHLFLMHLLHRLQVQPLVLKIDRRKLIPLPLEKLRNLWDLATILYHDVLAVASLALFFTS